MSACVCVSVAAVWPNNPNCVRNCGCMYVAYVPVSFQICVSVSACLSSVSAICV